MADEKESMTLDNVIDSFEELGYEGPLTDKTALKSTIENGLGNNEFIDVVDLLCGEIKVLMDLDESVTRPNGLLDSDSFSLEMRSFITEIGCPHKVLVQDLTALKEYRNRLLLLDFLTSQLMAARLIYLQKQKQEQEFQDGTNMSNPYSVAGNLSAILKMYTIAKPPSHVTVKMLFDKIITKTNQLVSESPKGHITQSLVTQGLSHDQWATLDHINEALTEEYSLRRCMLLTRCNVTVKSFKWSDKAKNKEEEFSTVYQNRLATMKERAPILIARVLAAKKDILAIERTSHGAVRTNTQCEVNKVLMGTVPDRGGRPNETRPPLEMPSFKKRTEPLPQERRDRGGYKGGAHGKRGGRGRVQGGWSSGGGSGYQGDWSGGSGQGGYQGNWDGGYNQQQQGGGYQYQGNQQEGGYDGYGRGGNRGRGGGQYQRQNSGSGQYQRQNSGSGQYQRQNSGQQYYYS